METIIYGDARDELPIASESVQAAVFSPPYWGLRRYGASEKEIGAGSLDAYLHDEMPAVFDRLWDVLKPDGTVWMVIGDTAAGSGGAGGDHSSGNKKDIPLYRQGQTDIPKGQWCLVPDRLAIVLQERGWLVRSRITWNKGIIRPEDINHTKRPGISTETIFMLTKSTKYKFNSYAIKALDKTEHGNVWNIRPNSKKRGHMAPFPQAIPERCILASTDVGDLVFDPFVGSGTTLRAATHLQRDSIGLDLYNFQNGLVGQLLE